MALNLVLLLAGATTSALALVVPQQFDTKQHVPGVHQLMQMPVERAASQPRELVSVIDSKINALANYVVKSHKENEQALAVQAMEYGKKLSEQGDQTKMIEGKIQQLRGQISHQESQNKVIRADAAKLLESTTALVQGIRRLESNLTFGQEFAHNAIDSAASALLSPEMKLLDELDKGDAARRAEAEHKEKLELLAQTKGSLLQIGSSSQHKKEDTAVDDASELVGSLLPYLGELPTQQAASLERLKANFTAEFELGHTKQASASKQQAQLEDELQREESLGSELQAAVAHLRANKATLETQSRGLAAFASRLGSLGGSLGK